MVQVYQYIRVYYTLNMLKLLPVLVSIVGRICEAGCTKI